MSSSKQNLTAIKAWAEKQGSVPSMVADTEKEKDGGKMTGS